MSKNWIAVIGSPRKGKNTDLLTDYIISGLREKDIVVEKFYLDNRNISTCNGCEYCISAGICNIQDKLSEIIEHMKKADGYILASPSYNYNMTAQMKALLDRTFCLNDYSDGWKSRLSPGKKAIIVGVCKGPTQESMGYTVEGMVKSISELDVKIIDVIEYYNTKYVPVADNDSIRERMIERTRDYEMLY
ncbi:multimeric flavodoxin WrbA [Anaerosolibacter carboniphilus]|uniref:Multimeric flavodoxin WrbA n=1 Tax=Anaerosolibacter carboniphilus TaxID=1417629 RepID=A0A841KYN7_9FIRM|nr:NAD(P)H-dependent oxidoreductase [Anaerosolibacter carboniphilus]MBB6216012.1 multimeric flavodoxin WrbA [Anaerosolibacter carboniphilus]